MSRISDSISQSVSQSETSNMFESDKLGIYAAKRYLDMDGVNDDYANLYDLINTTINGNDAEIWFKDESAYIGTNISIPANIKLKFLNGGMLKPKSGVAITGVNAKIEAGLYQIFDLSLGGTIAGTWDINGIHPEWFGVKRDGINDYTVAFEKTLSVSTLINIKTILLTYGTYVIGALDIPEGITLCSFDSFINHSEIQNVVLKRKGTSNTNTMFIKLNRGSSLIGIKLDGDKTNCTVTCHGVYINNALCNILYCESNNFTGDGIRGGAMDGKIVNVSCGNNDGWGMNIPKQSSNDGTDMILNNIWLSGNLDGFYSNAGGKLISNIKSFLNFRDGFVFDDDTFVVNNLFSQENGRHGMQLNSTRMVGSSIFLDGNGSDTKSDEYISEAIELYIDSASQCQLSGKIELGTTGDCPRAIYIAGTSRNNQIHFNVSVPLGNITKEYFLQDLTSRYNEIVINGIDYSNKYVQPTCSEKMNLLTDSVPNSFEKSLSGSPTITVSYSEILEALKIILTPDDASNIVYYDYYFDLVSGESFFAELEANIESTEATGYVGLQLNAFKSNKFDIAGNQTDVRNTVISSNVYNGFKLLSGLITATQDCAYGRVRIYITNGTNASAVITTLLTNLRVTRSRRT